MGRFILPKRLMIGANGGPPLVLAGEESLYRQTSNSTGARTRSHTVSADTTCLVICVGFRTGTTIGSQSASFNGVAMDAGPGANTTGGTPNGGSYIYYMMNPPVGTFTASVTTTSNQRVNFVCINLTNVGSVEAGSATNTTSSTASRTVVVSAAAVVIAASCFPTGNTSPTSLTGTTVVDDADGATGYGVSYTEESAAVSRTMSHAYGSSNKKTIAAMGFYN